MGRHCFIASLLGGSNQSNKAGKVGKRCKACEGSKAGQRSHRGNTAAREVTATCQKLPKRIFPKVNMYAKSTMETAVGENNVFKMLNDPPPQRHKLGTIILNGDAHKRNEYHLSHILWGVTQRQRSSYRSDSTMTTSPQENLSQGQCVC